MTPLESSGSIITRPEHPSAEETEENYCKNNFMKMLEEIKIFLKEIKEKTKTKLE